MRNITAPLVKELSAYLLLAGLFLAVYVFRYAAPIEAIPSHLILLFTIWCAIALLRGALHRIVPAPTIATLLSATIAVASLFLMAAYYIAVLASLESWGRVITWPLMVTYAPQAMELARALGIAELTVWLSIGGLVIVGVYWIRAATKRRDWTAELAAMGSAPLVLVCVAAGFGIVGARLYAYAAYPASTEREPLSLTLFPDEAVVQMQTHANDGSELLDRQEDVARAKYVANPQPKRRNIILVVGDALRPDHMSVNGYGRPTTPFLDSLHQAGKVRQATDMTATCAESSCGLLGILQSKYVHQLTRRAISLYEVLRLHGYRIEQILSGDHTNFYGLKSAYGPVDRYFDGSMTSKFYMNDDALVLDYVQQMPRWNGQPVLLQFHLMSSHGLGKRHEDLQRFGAGLNYYRPGGKQPARNGVPDERVANFYDNGVAQLDEMLRRIVATLSDKGYVDGALVIVTADHGDMLGEYGEFMHSKTVHQAVLRVPFLMIDFGKGAAGPAFGKRPASQVDIAPTILAELDMPIPETWSGKPLQSGAGHDYIFFQQGPQFGLVDVRDPQTHYKYWVDYRTREEFAIRLTDGVDESANQIEQFDPALRRTWALRVAQQGASLSYKRIEH